MPRVPNLDRARAELERAALSWARGLDPRTGDGIDGVDMEKRDTRLFEACARYRRAIDGPQPRTVSA